MEALTDPTGIVALAAVAIALVALAIASVLAVRIRRLRAAQAAVLGDERRDLTEHAAEMQAAFVTLREWMEETAEGLDERVGAAEARLDGVLMYRALVRYDAYDELSGHQSMSLAVLDARRNGVVVSSLATRGHFRLYTKQVVDGRGELELSPEEAEAIRLALAGDELRSVVLDT